jgi:hypothetical protein
MSEEFSLLVINSQDSKYRSKTLNIYRAIGLVLDFIHRLVCGRQKNVVGFLSSD